MKPLAWRWACCLVGACALLGRSVRAAWSEDVPGGGRAAWSEDALRRWSKWVCTVAALCCQGRDGVAPELWRGIGAWHRGGHGKRSCQRTCRIEGFKEPTDVPRTYRSVPPRVQQPLNLGRCFFTRGHPT
eukprot:gene553-biopygen8562